MSTRPSDRRCASGSCSSAGTPIETSTRRARGGVRARAADDRRPARVPAGADARRRTSRSRPTGRTGTGVEPEPLPGGRTHEFAAPARGRDRRAAVHASLYERRRATDGLGYNTAICVAPDGTLARAHAEDAPAGHRGLLRGQVLPGRRHAAIRSSTVAGTRSSGSRPAGTSGSPKSRGCTRCRAPRSSSTRPRSVPSPTTRTSTPSRCGSR